MLRFLAAALTACLVSGGVGGPRQARAQQATTAEQGWNDSRTTALVARAIERRARVLADSGLVDYQALARGFLTFLAQVGEGFPDPPKIVKADELAVEVYWRAPDLSKQRVVGRRDTLLLPTDINYHRDHLGIVQNNFPSIIRLGDGDEVRDVAHPLSALGARTYDYAISDSIRIQLPDRSIEVYEVKIRPKDPRAAAAVGAIYLDRAEGQVVRMAFSFTRAALKDRQLEDVAIVLENALIEGRFWLPRRQEIEIRRTGSWLDYPARGIIRGRWEISRYRVNQRLPAEYFRGPEIVQAPPAEMRRYPFQGRVLDSLPPDVRAVTDEEVRRIQEEARTLVRAGALRQVRSTSLGARSISDVVRVNRVEGFALGTGLVRRFGAGLSAAGRVRWGFDDEQLKGELALGWENAEGQAIRLRGFRSYRDALDEPEGSGVRNSLAAQEFGSDWTQPYDAWGGAVEGDLGSRLGVRWQLRAGWERQAALAVNATPSRGSYEPTIPALAVEGPRAALTLTRPTALALWGTELTGRAELRGGWIEAREGARLGERWGIGRAAGVLGVERPTGSGRLVLRTTAAVTLGADLPPQEFVYMGGPWSAPGYDFASLVGRFGASQRIEWRVPVPFVAVPLGRYGSTGASATLAPYAHVAYVARVADDASRGAGWYPALGVGLLTIFDVLRVDVARGMRDGRWLMGIDVTRDFWPIF
jgi:hypothetical protein